MVENGSRQSRISTSYLIGEIITIPDGKTDLGTAAQAAEALRPIAGVFASLLFSLGVIGTGLLALPVLGGSAGYAVGEALRWPVGLERKAMQAKAFYGVLAVATLIVAIIVVQNREPVATHVLFATVVMPHTILLFITAAAGFALGVLLIWTLIWSSI